MASGVKVHDSVSQAFHSMKLKKSAKKAIFFCFSKDEKNIIVDEEKEILSSDCKDDFFQRLKALFLPKQCSYALLDIHYVTGESTKEDLIFVMWAPEDASIKQRLLYASSKQSVKHVLTGVHKQWEVHSQDDLTIEQLAQKLSTNKVKSLEGKAL
ncbi:destrin [Bombina bombina]|uniref:destrin n=1 Tax=Bombina bombina TaxID=8345 RepID=UPI00235AF8F3|nr:destrin [Bombina bombina]